MFQKGDLVRYLNRNPTTYPYYLGIVLRMFKDNFTDVFFAEVLWHTGWVSEEKLRDLEVISDSEG